MDFCSRRVDLQYLIRLLCLSVSITEVPYSFNCSRDHPDLVLQHGPRDKHHVRYDVDRFKMTAVAVLSCGVAAYCVPLRLLATEFGVGNQYPPPCKHVPFHVQHRDVPTVQYTTGSCDGIPGLPATSIAKLGVLRKSSNRDWDGGVGTHPPSPCSAPWLEQVSSLITKYSTVLESSVDLINVLLYSTLETRITQRTPTPFRHAAICYRCCCFNPFSAGRGIVNTR